MAIQTFNINIDGYWRDKNKAGILRHSGIYFVYEAKYNKEEDTVSLLSIIYIGESENVCSSIDTHEKYEIWKRHVNSGNELCFSTGYADANNRERLEAAYIMEHKPPVNTEYKISFPFDTTTVLSKGKTALLSTKFTVYKTY